MCRTDISRVLAMGVTKPEKALIYITAYTVGPALPFFIMVFLLGRAKWILKYSNLMMKIGGSLMIVTGFLLVTGQLSKITTFLIRLYGGFTGF